MTGRRIATLVIALVLGGAAGLAQAPTRALKVLVLYDMEGVSGAAVSERAANAGAIDAIERKRQRSRRVEKRAGRVKTGILRSFGVVRAESPDAAWREDGMDVPGGQVS